jgi:integrase/recombinase XerD
LIDIQDRKLILRKPKSGKEHEIVFIPQKVADRLRDYTTKKCKTPQDRIFAISYEAARMVVLKAGKLFGIHLRPHDLRRHSATYASRSGVPIEIVRKIILRHANLSTTQPQDFNIHLHITSAVRRGLISINPNTSDLRYTS